MNGYVAAGYGATLVGLVGYAAFVLRRARSLRARSLRARSPQGSRSATTPGAST